MKCGSREWNTDHYCEFSFGRKKQTNLHEILEWKPTEADALENSMSFITFQYEVKKVKQSRYRPEVAQRDPGS
jgi:hypothetical protein